MVVCPKCGANVPDDAKFCPVCGQVMAAPDQSQPAAQPQQQQPQQDYYAAQQPQQQPPQQDYYANQQPQQNYYNQQQGYNYQPNQQQGQGYQTNPADIAENKGICVLCYLGILLLIPLLTKPNSGYVKYHSNQGLLLVLFNIAISILMVIPILGWIVGIAGWVFSVVCLIMGIINTTSGVMKPLPLIGKFSLIK